MIRKALSCAILAIACVSASATATYHFQYAGLDGFDETSGQGTFTTAVADLTHAQPVLSATGTYTDATDDQYGLSPVPIIGVTASGAVSHLTYDNLVGGPSLLFSNAGLVLTGLREKSNGFFSDQLGYINLYSDMTPSGNPGYYVDSYLPDYGSGDFIAPVSLQVSLIGSTNAPAVPETSTLIMLCAGLLFVAAKRLQNS